jgi:hypothetical protein
LFVTRVSKFPAVIGILGSRATIIVPMFVPSLTFFHEISETSVPGDVIAVTPEGVSVITGLVTPSDGEYGVEGCSVVHPAATRSATRKMLPIRNILAGDMWNKVVVGKKIGLWHNYEYYL